MMFAEGVFENGTQGRSSHKSRLSVQVVCAVSKAGLPWKPRHGCVAGTQALKVRHVRIFIV